MSHISPRDPASIINAIAASYSDDCAPQDEPVEEKEPESQKRVSFADEAKEPEPSTQAAKDARTWTSFSEFCAAMQAREDPQKHWKEVVRCAILERVDALIREEPLVVWHKLAVFGTTVEDGQHASFARRVMHGKRLVVDERPLEAHSYELVFALDFSRDQEDQEERNPRGRLE